MDDRHSQKSTTEASEFDRAMMRECLELARRALGRTTPNPLVGAVVVKDGEVVGRGFHPGAGQPHAEVFALREAGERALGATVYVNLEPCNHYGRTPPCSEALIAAGVAKVVVGMVDPDPRVSGGGIERLRSAGIEVVVAVEEEACRLLNEAFVHRILHRRPFGILKYAMTLDGKIAASTGHSNWVTGKPARHEVHLLRAACDAVIVGGGTVRHDNPRLTSHSTDLHNPLRVVMSRTLNLPGIAAPLGSLNPHSQGKNPGKESPVQLWDTSEAPTLVLTESGASPDLQEKLLKKGVEVVELNPLAPARAMEYLYDRQLSSVLWECGGILAARAIAEGAVQKVMAFIAPKIIGGESAPSPVGDLGLPYMTDALTLERVQWKMVGSDFSFEGYLK